MTKATPSYALHGMTALSEFLGDLVVYRNLEPPHGRLPGLTTLWKEIGMPEYRLPRKTEPEYAQLLALLLERARALESDARLKHLLFIGDTLHNDGTSFRNLKAATGWDGYAFIARDAHSEAPEHELQGDWYLANRWSALPAFVEFAEKQGIALGPETAVVIDLDKTAIGARGRNDKVIDQARLDGVEQTVSGLLASRFDPRAFVSAYNELNQPQYHPFTSDNQDYVAYICLILGGGLYALAGLVDAVRANKITSFHQFIAQVHERRDELAELGLLPIHEEVWVRVQQGDPTPFKAFRYNEYLTTAARFGDLPGGTAQQALAQRIVITQEVRQTALELRQAGALILGVSDKPDEASLPRPEQAAAGYQPLHRLETLAVGQAL